MEYCVYPSTSSMGTSSSFLGNNSGLALVIISIVSFLILIVLYFIFVFRPIQRIETKIDQAAIQFTNLDKKLTTTANKVDQAVTKIETVVIPTAQDIKNTLDTLKPTVCQILANPLLNVTTLPNFCLFPITN